MTSVQTPRPSFTPPQTQNTAHISEFRCLFTLDIRRKAKRWQDGLLRFHTFNNRIMVYDDRRNKIGDAFWKETRELCDGDELELERGIMVEVGEGILHVQQNRDDVLKAVQGKMETTPRQGPAIVPHNTMPVTPRPPPMASEMSAMRGVAFSPEASAITRPESVSQPVLLRPRPLNELLGSNRGVFGRSIGPKKSTYTLKRTIQETDIPAASTITQSPKRPRLSAAGVQAPLGADSTSNEHQPRRREPEAQTEEERQTPAKKAVQRKRKSKAPDDDAAAAAPVEPITDSTMEPTTNPVRKRKAPASKTKEVSASQESAPKPARKATEVVSAEEAPQTEQPKQSETGKRGKGKAQTTARQPKKGRKAKENVQTKSAPAMPSPPARVPLIPPLKSVNPIRMARRNTRSKLICRDLSRAALPSSPPINLSLFSADEDELEVTAIGRRSPSKPKSKNPSVGKDTSHADHEVIEMDQSPIRSLSPVVLSPSEKERVEIHHQERGNAHGIITDESEDDYFEPFNRGPDPELRIRAHHSPQEEQVPVSLPQSVPDPPPLSPLSPFRRPSPPRSQSPRPAGPFPLSDQHPALIPPAPPLAEPDVNPLLRLAQGPPHSSPLFLNPTPSPPQSPPPPINNPSTSKTPAAPARTMIKSALPPALRSHSLVKQPNAPLNTSKQGINNTSTFKPPTRLRSPVTDPLRSGMGNPREAGDAEGDGGPAEVLELKCQVDGDVGPWSCEAKWLIGWRPPGFE
ncbi:MAG: hypothetical protein M1814_001954 [Vezdaea aestivalis]|nr:MAG: hypothetical protein M1814_001954 [Vezdaea aestivalis]